MGGFGVLHCAACQGHLEVCKYLVEELGGGGSLYWGVLWHLANMKYLNCCGSTLYIAGVTPFMTSAQSGDISNVKYLFDHGGDLMKADAQGRNVLRYAVCTGSSTVTEFLLSKGIPVDIDFGDGTPLYHASINENLLCLNNYFDNMDNMCFTRVAGADVNGKCSVVSPLVFATGHRGYTNFIRLLLKAGADPNIPDDVPMTLSIFQLLWHATWSCFSSVRDCREEVEMLFPLTSPIPNVRNRSIDGIISHAKLENAKPMKEEHVKVRKATMRSLADKAFRTCCGNPCKLLFSVLKGSYVPCHTTLVDPNATLYSNRSLCKLKLGDGKGALSDAYRCRTLRPDWAKACYRQAKAHMLLKEYKQACDALLDAQKLDPGNEEIERALSKAIELMKISPDEDEE
uniref:Uncharacterized protein n=1 Tax=Setaria italica TaxID=4555 RepID=K4ALA4_SETIT